MKLRRLFRFRLATMLIGVAMLCLGCFWLSTEFQRARTQARIVAELQRADAWIIFQHRFGDQPWVDDHVLAKLRRDGDIDESKGPTQVTLNGKVITAPPAPPWIVRALGAHYFVRPATVYLHISSSKRALLQDVKSLNTLLQLDLSGIADGDLAGLDCLPQLRYVSLCDAAITDASIPDLSKLKSLERLTLSSTGISHEGFIRLKSALPNCKILGDPADRIGKRPPPTLLPPNNYQ